MYSVVWNYKIKSSYIEKFEQEYGSNGTWSRLFKKSPHYKGSFLHKSDEETNAYLLIDVWDSKSSYEDFKKEHAAIYQELGLKFEEFHEKEEKIGSYNSL